MVYAFGGIVTAAALSAEFKSHMGNYLLDTQMIVMILGVIFIGSSYFYLQKSPPRPRTRSLMRNISKKSYVL